MNLPLLKHDAEEAFFKQLVNFTNQDAQHCVERAAWFYVAILLAECFEYLVPFLLAHKESREEKTISIVIPRQ